MNHLYSRIGWVESVGGGLMLQLVGGCWDWAGGTYLLYSACSTLCCWLLQVVGALLLWYGRSAFFSHKSC